MPRNGDLYDEGYQQTSYRVPGFTLINNVNITRVFGATYVTIKSDNNIHIKGTFKRENNNLLVTGTLDLSKNMLPNGKNKVDIVGYGLSKSDNSFKLTTALGEKTINDMHTLFVPLSFDNFEGTFSDGLYVYPLKTVEVIVAIIPNKFFDQSSLPWIESVRFEGVSKDGPFALIFSLPEDKNILSTIIKVRQKREKPSTTSSGGK
jgi:hypothetical protein